MTLVKALCIAISMYSKIPVFQFQWKEKEMRFAIAFFPLVGAVIGAAEYLIFKLLSCVEAPLPVMVPVMCAIPLIITGGIHLDGYMDTSDAISSYMDREKRLEILKDPHIGAYAVIRTVVFTEVFISALAALIYFAPELMNIWVCGFVLSRMLSALSVVTFPCANRKGTLYSFSGKKDEGFNRPALIIILCEIVLLAAGMIIYDHQGGAMVIGAELAVFLYYKVRSEKLFGGITGDLAGWFLCLAELGMTVVPAVAAIIIKTTFV